MITFQRDVRYGGDPTKASFKSVTVVFHVPVFEYTAVSADAGTAATTGLELMSTRTRRPLIEGAAAAMTSLDLMSTRSRRPLVEGATAAPAAVDIVRRATPDIQSESIEQPLDGTIYHIALDDAFVAGANDVTRVQASRYHLKAVLEGSVDKLLRTRQHLMASWLCIIWMMLRKQYCNERKR